MNNRSAELFLQYNENESSHIFHQQVETKIQYNTFAITSVVSLKSLHLETLDLAKNSSIKRIPIL